MEAEEEVEVEADGDVEVEVEEGLQGEVEVEEEVWLAWIEVAVPISGHHMSDSPCRRAATTDELELLSDIIVDTFPD